MAKQLETRKGIFLSDPQNGGKIAGVHLPTWAVQVIALGAALLTFFNVNTKLDDIEARAVRLNHRVTVNEHGIDRLEKLDKRIHKLATTVHDIEDVTDDIRNAIGEAIRRGNN